MTCDTHDATSVAPARSSKMTNYTKETKMRLSQITLAAALLMAFATPPAVFAQSTDVHKDREHGGEVVKEPKAEKSTRTRKEVQGEAARQHKEGTMQHGGEVIQEPKAAKPAKPGRTREEVKAEAAKQHKEGTMQHGGEVIQEPQKK